MDYRLGLDLGTTSIGAVAVVTNKRDGSLEIPAHQLRIFPEPVENDQGTLQPKKAARRKARQQRTQLERRAQRLKDIAKLAGYLGLERQAILPDTGQHLPRLRALAATEQVGLEDFFRILLKLAKRRGYAGGFRSQDSDGEVKHGVARLHDVMQSRGCNSLGQYLYDRHQRGLPVHLKIRVVGGVANKKNKAANVDPESENLYATRELVVAEFDTLWQTQAAFYPVLNSQQEGKTLKQLFQDVIFYQRPLKSVAGMVGKCPLESNLPRAPRAHPAVQAFRIEKQLSDLRWGIGKQAKEISLEQKAVIRQLLQTQESVSFSAIEKALEKAGCPKTAGKGLNLQHIARDDLRGDGTSAAFRRMGLEQQWLQVPAKAQTQVINLLADMGSPEQFDTPDWHTSMACAKQPNKDEIKYRQFAPETVSFINALVDSGKFGRLASMKLEGGRSAYSIKVLQRLTEWLQNPEWPADWSGDMIICEENAVRVCYPQANQPPALQDKLPLPPKTGNDVVDGALRQLYYTLNHFRDQLGAWPASIVVEMSRELGQGVTRRNEIHAQNAAGKKARDDARKELEKHGCVANERNIKRYLLAQEQDWKCPYCQGHNTLSLADVTNGNITNFEHILPRSLTRVGLKRSEIVLAHRHCNDAKGDRTPWQAWGNGQAPENWKAVEIMADILDANGKKMFGKDKGRGNAMRRKAKLLLLQDFENEVLTDESIADFSDRQFHETSWIAKEAAQWLRGVCGDVAVSRGQMTAHLRRSWGLETVIPQVRLHEGLPILDEEGKQVSAEEFEDCRPAWEGHSKSKSGQYVERRLDKRIDHRHHLIDALTIALTSRQLYQAMARHYREDCERNQRGEKSRIRLHIDPPCRHVRDAALRMISTCEVWHKPDRYPAGQLFLDTTFGKAVHPATGKMTFTYRQAINALVGEKDSEDKARKQIQSIVSDDVRQLVLDALEKGIAKGLPPFAVLQQPIEYPQYSREGRSVYIKKVKCYGTSAENAKEVTHRNRQGRVLTKNLSSKGYAWLEIKLGDGKKIGDPVLVPLYQGMHQVKQAIPDGVIRFCKGDTVEDTKTHRRYVIRQFKSQAGGMLILTPVTETRGVEELTSKDGLFKPSGKSLLRFRLCECPSTALS
ncbi:MAG: hypothetical protein JG718_11120 [Candidatus Thiothrix moscowensis]|nr:hypothetical protein [Candidatus Thiothrix moscowensis]